MSTQITTVNEWLFIAPMRMLAVNPHNTFAAAMAQTSCFQSRDIKESIEAKQSLPLLYTKAEISAWLKGGAK